MNLHPTEDRIIVKRAEAQNETKYGILLPENSKEAPVKGTVLKVGPGKMNDSGTRQQMDIKENDTVIFSKYSGSEVVHEGEEFLIMKESDVLCIVK